MDSCPAPCAQHAQHLQCVDRKSLYLAVTSECAEFAGLWPMARQKRDSARLPRTVERMHPTSGEDPKPRLREDKGLLASSNVHRQRTNAVAESAKSVSCAYMIIIRKTQITAQIPEVKYFVAE